MHISIALKSEKFLTLGEKPTISIDPPPAESELGPKPFLRVHPGLGVVRWFFGQLAPGPPIQPLRSYCGLVTMSFWNPACTEAIGPPLLISH